MEQRPVLHHARIEHLQVCPEALFCRFLQLVQPGLARVGAPDPADQEAATGKEALHVAPRGLRVEGLLPEHAALPVEEPALQEEPHGLLREGKLPDIKAGAVVYFDLDDVRVAPAAGIKGRDGGHGEEDLLESALRVRLEVLAEVQGEDCPLLGRAKDRSDELLGYISPRRRADVKPHVLRYPVAAVGEGDVAAHRGARGDARAAADEEHAGKEKCLSFHLFPPPENVLIYVPKYVPDLNFLIFLA